MAARAAVNLASVDGIRSVTVNASFFTGYKHTALKPNEVLVSVVIPFTTKVCAPDLAGNSLSSSGAIPYIQSFQYNKVS